MNIQIILNQFICKFFCSFFIRSKVFLECEDKARAERILNDERKEEKNKDIGDTISKIREREQSERIRYENYYNVDYYDKELYDLIIDTTNIPASKVIEKIINAANLL